MAKKWLRIVFIIVLGLSAEAYADPVTLTFNGEQLHLLGESIVGPPYPPNYPIDFKPMFSDGFLNAKTITVSISFDTNQQDVNPDPNTGTYRGSLSVNIPELGHSGSATSSIAQISSVDNTSNSEDQFNASGGCYPCFWPPEDEFPLFNTPAFGFSVHIFGNGSMLVNDQLPTGPLNWIYGNLSVYFSDDGAYFHEVRMAFSPIHVPESSTMAFLVSSLFGLGWAGRKFKKYLI